MSPPSSSPVESVAFRLSRLAYLVVLLLAFCVLPVSFTDLNGSSSVVIGPRLAFLVIPVGAAVYIARVATVVSGTGIRVSALLGSRTLDWDDVRGLSVNGRSVYAVCADGSVRLPCVGIAQLAALTRASGGRLPQVERARLKPAPARRRR